MKRSILTLAVVATVFATPVRAQTATEIVGEIVGGVTGAVICRNLGNGVGRTVAVAGCTVVGSQIGRAITRPTPNPYGPPVYQQGGPQPQIPVYSGDPCANEVYTPSGVYNPGVARAYCRGAMQGQYESQIRAERNAYNEARQAQGMAERQATRWGAAGNY